MREVDVVDKEYTIPKPYRTMRRYVLKTPYCTEIHHQNKKTKRGSLQWFNTKHPELAPDKLLLNKELFKVNFYDTAELVGFFFKNVVR